MNNEKSLSKADLYFLALVSSVALKLEKIDPEYKIDRGVGIFYVPEQRAIARNLRTLNELYPIVRHQVELLESGEDPLKSLYV